MANLRLARCLVFPAFLIAACPGCQSFHVYRPVAVQAIDADTKKPIPGAEVRINYLMAPSSFAPVESSGTTGGDGVARLRATPYEEAAIFVEATAPGYLSGQRNVTTEAVRAIEPAGLFEKPGLRPVSFVVEMYAEPGPAVELVLPDGFHGPVKVAVEIRDDVPCPPGQRLFSYAVPQSGVLHVTAPALLRRVFSPDYRARFANGTVLVRQPADGDIGFWCVKTEGGYEHFLVGTRAEYQELLRADRTADSPLRLSGGGTGGGRGGHKRSGNQPPDTGPAGMQ
jgi:hypothetical protein